MKLLDFATRHWAAALVAAVSLALCSCTPHPTEKEQAQELEATASQLHRDFYDKVSVFHRYNPQEFKDYEEFVNKVHACAGKFMKDLSACKTQEDADQVYAAVPFDSLRGENEKMKATLQEVVKKSPVITALDGFNSKCKRAMITKSSIRESLQNYVDENGTDAYPEEVAEINLLVDGAEGKIKSVKKGIEGFSSMLDSKRQEISKYSEEVEKILQGIAAAREGWVPPPPAPFHPERILFTVETTPALYDSLLATLLQQYKNYTFLYTASNGDRCVTDAKNTEGVVIHLVEPAGFGTAVDSLEQGRADLVFAFRQTYPDEVYEKLEEKSSEDTEDLNAVLATGLGYSAMVLKVSQDSQMEKLETHIIDQKLRGVRLYTGQPGTLSAELADTILRPMGVEVQPADKPERSGTASADTLAAVAFTREPSSAKDVRIARTPSKENVYFWPRPGDIASGRYAFNASINAALNPASQNNAEARKFVDYVLSDEGQAVVKAADFISRNEYEETDPELLQLRKLFEKEGYSIGRIITYDTFLFPKNDASIIKKPEVVDRKKEFKEFDSTIRSNFGHINGVLEKTKVAKGMIAVGVIGHASSEGGETVNKPLSVNRAKYTASCIKHGDGLLILTDGMSSKVPVDDNSTEEGRVRNRRATAYVLEVFEVGTKK